MQASIVAHVVKIIAAAQQPFERLQLVLTGFAFFRIARRIGQGLHDYRLPYCTLAANRIRRLVPIRCEACALLGIPIRMQNRFRD